MTIGPAVASVVFPKIKICGITNLADARVSIEAGADTLGFVLYRASPRYIDPATVKTILDGLPPWVLAIGVFVNEEAQIVRDIVDACGLALAQLHGDETTTYCESLGRPILRGIRLKDRRALVEVAECTGQALVRGFVVDAFSEQRFGGTGVVGDWELAAEIARGVDLLLAGGLTPENVQEAIQRVHPSGVDVSSGVETSPGKKDPEKVRAFIHAAQRELL